MVTGAASGIGRAFAERFAFLGVDLFVITRTEEDFYQLQNSLREINSTISILGEWGDLANIDFVNSIKTSIESPELNILSVVNNAGFGTSKIFSDDILEEEIDAIKVMTIAPLVFSHTLISKASLDPNILKVSIINISSISAFLPRGNYGAIKAWLNSFSYFLYSYQFDDLKIIVTWACPGLTRNTKFQEKAKLDTAKWPKIFWINPSLIVMKVLGKHESGGGQVIPGRINLLIYLSSTKLVPIRLKKRLLGSKLLRAKRP